MPNDRPTPLDLLATTLTIAAVVHYGAEALSPTIGAASAVGYNLLFGIGVVTCLVTVGRLRAAGATGAARTWQLLAAGLACVLVAQAIAILVFGPVADVTADLAALAFYPLVVVGFWREMPRVHSRPVRHAAMLDLALVFVAAVTILVALLARGADERSWNLVPSMAYGAVSPAMALVAIAAVANWYASSSEISRPALGVAAVATVGLALGDVIAIGFPPTLHRWSNVPWAIGVWFLIIGAQRVRADRSVAAGPSRVTRGATLSGAIPFAAAAALVITLLSALFASGRPETVLLAAGGSAIVLLLLGRHWMALRTASALERARAEQEARLRESERIDALGRMARGVAHDFNGMLTVILGNAELALDSAADDGEVRESLERIREVSITATAITRQLLDFARSGAVETRTIDVAGVLRAQWRTLTPTLPTPIAVELRADEGPFWVRTGAGFVEQVLHNLVSNARDAMPEGGTLRVDLRGSQTSVTLVIADSGAGMDDATRERIFEPFFSTKGSRGTGIGLATVYGIVRQCGGEIQVESAPGHGTTFTVELPRVAVGAASVQPRSG